MTIPHLLTDSDVAVPAAGRSRVLVFGGVPTTSPLLEGEETVRLSDPMAVADALADGGFAAVVADPVHLASVLQQFRRDALILSFAERAIALLDPDGRVEWCNSRLNIWCGGDAIGTPLLKALRTPSTPAAAESADPLEQVRTGLHSSLRLNRPNLSPEFLDIAFHPVYGPAGTLTQILALCRDVSLEVEQQRKFDTLHAAGRALADLDVTQLADMSRSERIALLKVNLRKYIHDLLHYDTIEIRLFDKRTNELKPLLEDGMTSEAANRRLEALPEHNGVTGYVAYHRRSHLCPDTSKDPRYLIGASGACSSLTVPLIYNDELVGTFNVESPRLDSFSAEDLQFTELFSKEIATALHTLDLLTAQQTCAVTQSVDMVSREIALPLDEVMASAAVLMRHLGGRDEELVVHLRRIVEKARQVKDGVRKVGREAAEMPDPTESQLAKRPLSGKRVLVIEQDAQLRRQIHLMIERLGGDSETAGTAAEGLALLSGTEYDAVFTEVRPTDLGGYDTYKSIRQLRPGVRVAMTCGFAYDAAHSLVKAKADGLKQVLFKPFKQDQVVSAVLAPMS